MTRPATRLGPKTRDLLRGHGLTDAYIADLESGEVTWDLAEEGDPNEGEVRLLLFHRDGGQAAFASMSGDEATRLIRTFEFEDRDDPDPKRPSTFPRGDAEDWAGVRPDADWFEFVGTYRDACRALVALESRSDAPYLFLCRHTLELYLKTIIVLGQESMKLEPDLPETHDLRRLWTAAFPIAIQPRIGTAEELGFVRSLIDDYDQVDRRSDHFRYPVARKNKKIDHEKYLLSFSRKRQAEAMDRAFGVLDSVVGKLHMSVSLLRMFGSSGS